MNRLRTLRSERGFSLTEVIVTLLIASIVFAATLRLYTSAVGTSYDHQIRLATQVQAQAIMQTIGAELRNLGNGVPFDQANFQIGENTLAVPSVTEPIDVLLSNASQITFRLNETGEVKILTADFDPSASNEVFLTDVGNLGVNDPIYISNSVVSGEDGLFAYIAAVDTGANSVTLANPVVYSPGGVFEMGSILEETPEVTYKNAADGSGIVRDSGYGEVPLGEGSELTIEYLGNDGTALALPLTNQSVVDFLRAIRVTVTLTSQKTKKNGVVHSATVSQVFALRNLVYVF